jgi:hypothetical protein
MHSRLAALALLTVLSLCALARAGDPHKSAPQDPDPGFLEFLGSVDRLAELNPDYLAQTGAARPVRLPGKPPAASPPAPAPAPSSGAKNNE